MGNPDDFIHVDVLLESLEELNFSNEVDIGSHIDTLSNLLGKWGEQHAVGRFDRLIVKSAVARLFAARPSVFALSVSHQRSLCRAFDRLNYRGGAE